MKDKTKCGVKMWVNIFVMVVTALALCGQARADDGLPVFRLLGTQRGSGAGGMPCMMLQLAPPAGGRMFLLAIPNNNPMGGAVDPSKVVVNALQDAKKGDLLLIKQVNMMGVPSVGQIGKYTAKEGEDTPRGFIFEGIKEQQNGKDSVQTLELSKYKIPATVLIPNKTVEGKSEPDPDLLKVAGAFKEGDVVDVVVDATGRIPVLKMIDPYAPPEQGVFGKLTQADNNGVSVAAVEINQGGKTITAWIPGTLRDKDKKWIPDSQIFSAAKRCKAGGDIQFTVHHDGDVEWIKDIGPAERASAENGR